MGLNSGCFPLFQPDLYFIHRGGHSSRLPQFQAHYIGAMKNNRAVLEIIVDGRFILWLNGAWTGISLICTPLNKMKMTLTTPAGQLTADATAAMDAIKLALTALVNLEDGLRDNDSEDLADDILRAQHQLASFAEDFELVRDCIPFGL